MKVRKIDCRDMSSLAKYIVAYWKQRKMNFSLSWTLNYLKKGMTSEIKEERFICTDGKNIMGTIALLKYAEHVIELRDEVWKDDKIGSELLAHTISYAKKNKIRKIYSLAINSKVGFYRRNGFVKEGFLKDHFKKGENITIMSKFI